MANRNFPVDPTCPGCLKKDCVYEQHRLVARALALGVNSHGGLLVRELNEKDAAEADDEGWDDNSTRFMCIECDLEFGQAELVKASLKEGGYPDLRETSPEFRKFWDSVKVKCVPEELLTAEMLAWQAWRAAEVNAMANELAQVKV